jgi:hypothetical protein
MPYDDTEFNDRELTPAGGGIAGPAAGAGRAPTREQLEAQMLATQAQLESIRKSEEELSRKRAELEEVRRRRTEFQTGRAEMRDALTRGVGLLEKAEFEARRDAEQMARSLDGLREAQTNLEGLHEEQWTEQNWNTELSRSLTVIENARLEWQSARRKWPVLEGKPGADGQVAAPPPTLTTMSLGQLCRLGLALTWPLVLLGLLTVGLTAMLLGRR